MKIAYNVCMASLKRVNARISTDLERLVSELAKDQGVSVSAIVVRALQAFCEAQQPLRTPNLYETFRQAKLIGCFSGGSSMSSDYKKLLTESLERKFSGKA